MNARFKSPSPKRRGPGAFTTGSQLTIDLNPFIKCEPTTVILAFFNRSNVGIKL